jgi:hypothetical protein
MRGQPAAPRCRDPGLLGHQFAKLDAGNIGGDGVELAANIRGGRRLRIVGLELESSASQRRVIPSQWRAAGMMLTSGERIPTRRGCEENIEAYNRNLIGKDDPVQARLLCNPIL